MTKSIDAVASIFGAMKAGAAYVPVDPHGPAARNAYIFSNCQVKAAIVERLFVETLREEMEKLGCLPPMVIVDEAKVTFPPTVSVPPSSPVDR